MNMLHFLLIIICTHLGWGGGGSGGVYESGWFGNFEIFWNCYLKNGAIQSLI